MHLWRMKTTLSARSEGTGLGRCEERKESEQDVSDDAKHQKDQANYYAYRKNQEHGDDSQDDPERHPFRIELTHTTRPFLPLLPSGPGRLAIRFARPVLSIGRCADAVDFDNFNFDGGFIFSHSRKGSAFDLEQHLRIVRELFQEVEQSLHRFRWAMSGETAADEMDFVKHVLG